MRMASSRRVTPSAVISPVSTGWLNEVCTNDWAARLYTSDGRYSRSTEMSDASSRRSPDEVYGSRISRSCRWAIRSKFVVLLRRAMPTTS